MGIDLRLPQQVASNLKKGEKKVFFSFSRKMKSLVIFSFLITLALSKPIEIEDVGIETEDFNVDEITTSEQISEENFRSFRKPTKIRQAEIDPDAARNARFNFGYSIQDDINGAQVERSEQRDGLKLTVAYVADENGYRVTKMISEPIGDGPVTNKLGRAVVQMLVSGVETEYAIQASPMIDEQEEISAKNVNEEVDSTGPRGSTGPRDITGPRSLENIDA